MAQSSFAYKQISTKGLPLLGRGKSGVVYQIDEDTVVKIYHDGRRELNVLREYLVGRLMDEAGIRVPKAYEIVKSHEAFGIVYERLAGVSFRQLLEREDERFDEYCARYARFVRGNHAVAVDTDDGLSLMSMFERWADAIRIFSPAERRVVREMLAHVPDRRCLLHMDPKPENLLLLDDGSLAWIDLGECGEGHPALSLQELYMPRADVTVPGVSKKDIRVLRRFWHRFLQGYFAEVDPSCMPGIERGIHALAMLRILNALQLMELMRGNAPFVRALAVSIKDDILRDVQEGMDFSW